MTDFTIGYSDILSEEGGRIGLMTPTGPIYSADPEDMDFIAELSERDQISFEKRATASSRIMIWIVRPYSEGKKPIQRRPSNHRRAMLQSTL